MMRLATTAHARSFQRPLSGIGSCGAAIRLYRRRCLGGVSDVVSGTVGCDAQRAAIVQEARGHGKNIVILYGETPVYPTGMQARGLGDFPRMTSKGLMGQCARMPHGGVCRSCFLSGGLWLDMTLRTMRARGGYLRPSLLGCLDNTVTGYWTDRRVWWANAAPNRDVWLAHEQGFAQAAVPSVLRGGPPQLCQAKPDLTPPLMRWKRLVIILPQTRPTSSSCRPDLSLRSSWLA